MPKIFTPDYPFEIGKAVTVRDGKDVVIIAMRDLTAHALLAAEQLAAKGMIDDTDVDGGFALIQGDPGTGKSAFAKALGRETGRPTLILDIGALMGSLVGQSEERTRQALRIIDAMAPCVAMIDEVEKAFAGLNGNGDSGVSSRMFGTFLSWLNDHESDVFVVCTANDVSKLPPEFGRSERFDGVFFLDLPSREEKDAIWTIYLDLFEIGRDERLPDDENWTGAEVKACCRLSALLDVPLVQAAQNVVPVAVTAACRSTTGHNLPPVQLYTRVNTIENAVQISV